jgi:transcription elongation factor Elf1
MDRSKRSRWAIFRRMVGAARPAPVTGLHECPDCRSDMVCPVHWHSVDSERWSMNLRCGECGAERKVVASNAQAADFDSALNERLRKLERALERIETSRMAAEIDAFVVALERDLIDAADFAR